MIARKSAHASFSLPVTIGFMTGNYPTCSDLHTPDPPSRVSILFTSLSSYHRMTT